MRIALTAVFVAFVGAWAFVGVRGLVLDDSRWAWGMFPYVLAVEVKEVRFVDAAGKTVRVWDRKQKPRVPRPFRTGLKDETWGYGKGSYDDVMARLLALAAKDAPRRATAVEAVFRTQRSERGWVDEVARRELR
ncbi:MAG: hypothetical protein Q8O67_14100 [Deltaproteobacteria bacterium]|nr:hypothetical protein [Deltaproteobacteria bacterium]